MPAKWLVHPTRGKVTFEEGPALFDMDGLLPKQAVQAVLAELEVEREPHEFVRPSDVNPEMTCRRKVVHDRFNPHGVDPFDIWEMKEGTALHDALGTQEVVVPKDGGRLPVLGVPMRGRVDILTDDAIVDIKTAAPFWIAKFPPKGSPDKRPFAVVWEPPFEREVGKWQPQLSIYNILLTKDGHSPRQKGVVWRKWKGVKKDNKPFTKFEFPLLTEGRLEGMAGPWVRSLAEGLGKAKALYDQGQPTLPVVMEQPADGLQFVKKDGSRWACDRCELKEACLAQSGFSPW